jgi:hypothetical protein
VGNVVADALSRLFDGHCPESPEIVCATVLSSLPFSF